MRGSASKLGRATVAVSVLALSMLGILASGAAAAQPGWHVSAQMQPTWLAPGAVGTIYVQVANVGSASTDGSPVTVIDRLPANLEAVEAGELADVETVTIGNARWECEGIDTVVCTNSRANQPTIGPGLALNATDTISGGGVYSPDEDPEIAIVVKARPGQTTGTELGSVEVSGGGASLPSQAVEKATISGVSAPPGIASLSASNVNEDGSSAGQAGQHPYKTIVELDLNSEEANLPGGESTIVPVGDAKDISVAAPVGFIGNPDSTPRCSREAFDGGENEDVIPTCPTSTQIGNVTVTLGNAGHGLLTLGLPVYNLVPPPGLPAQFGFQNFGIYGVLNARVRTGGDYGITEEINDTAQRSLINSSVILWGVPAASANDHERYCITSPTRAEAHRGCGDPESNLLPFLSNPTTCGSDLVWQASVDTWLQPETFSEMAVRTGSGPGEEGTLHGCSAVPFEPAANFTVDTPDAESPAALKVNLHVPQSYGVSSALASADVKSVTARLPAGLVVNPSSANGLAACTEAQIELDGANAPACPDASKLGTVEVDTPLLDHPLPGAIYLAQPHQNPFGSLLALYLTVDDPISGVILKVPGEVSGDSGTGQLTASFKENPQLPFEDLKVNFFGGPGAALTTPATCGTYTTATDLTPWSAPEGADAFRSSSFPVSAGAGGSACASTESQLPNKPAFEAGTVNPIAGSYSPFVLKLNRENGSQRVSSIETTLPEGLLGRLTGIPYCPDSAIASAAGKSGRAEQASSSCPAASEVGTANVGAGSGTPFHVEGKAYLAGPYKGAPISLAIITPAVAGPFDLGTVVVRTALYVNEYSAQVRAVSDPLPSILEGIPLDIRSIALQLNRPNFTLNPTSCEAKEITGTVTSTLGQKAPLNDRFQVGACNALEFKPGLKLSLTGQTKRAGHPALKAVVTYPKDGAYANIARAQVSLPGSEFLDQGNLNKVCKQAELTAGNCPKTAIYGKVKAWTPLEEAPLTGNVYLGVGFGYKLPALVAELNGQIRVLLKGKIDTDKEKGIRSTFEAVPDAPVSRFVLEMKGGKKYGLLENSTNICKKPGKAQARFTAQNGKVELLTPTIANSCGKGKKKGGTGTKKSGR